MPVHLVQLVVGGSCDPWRLIGLNFDDDHLCRIGRVNLLVTDGLPGSTLGWAFEQVLPAIDGIAAGIAHPAAAVVARDYSRIDHVVVMTDSLERTSGALSDTALLERRRIREVGDGVRQAFHRSGEVIIEVVQTPTAKHASLWGFVLVADAFDEVVTRLGKSVVTAPKPAVQAGRRIATVRREVGLGVNVALMSPDP